MLTQTPTTSLRKTAKELEKIYGIEYKNRFKKIEPLKEFDRKYFFEASLFITKLDLNPVLFIKSFFEVCFWRTIKPRPKDLLSKRLVFDLNKQIQLNKEKYISPRSLSTGRYGERPIKEKLVNNCSYYFRTLSLFNHITLEEALLLDPLVLGYLPQQNLLCIND